MSKRKKQTAVISLLVAAAIALSGTYAWQSMNQMALNEKMSNRNPGGRLHDDFNGENKDVYIENYGDEVIFARVRLDEYMEIGTGAGLKPDDSGYASKTAKPLVDTAKIDDPTTWEVHKPYTTYDPATGLDAADPTKDDAALCEANTASTLDESKFHHYWKWTMGGQTVYMPTFDRNQDSLNAEINGTWDGLDAKDELHYDDYVTYELGQTITGDAIYDADDNDFDEGVEDGIPGVNYVAQSETHTAALTIDGSVMTMAQWKQMVKDRKAGTGAFAGQTADPDYQGYGPFWVYDTDGWAYWAQPILPGTATGLLLDSIELQQSMGEKWYYAIDAVAQMITADSLGNQFNGKGFYDTTEGTPPTEDALELLKLIGVDTTSIGTIDIALTGADNGLWQGEDYTSASITATATVTIPEMEGTPDQAVTWALYADEACTTALNTGVATIDAGTGALTITKTDTDFFVQAKSEVYGIKGTYAVTFQEETFEMTLTATKGSETLTDPVMCVTSGSDVTLTITPTIKSSKTGEAVTTGTVEYSLWNADHTSQITDATTVAGLSTVGANNTTTLTVKDGITGYDKLVVDASYIPVSATESAATALLSVYPRTPNFTMEIVQPTDASVSVYQGQNQQFAAKLTCDIEGYPIPDDITWSVSRTSGDLDTMTAFSDKTPGLLTVGTHEATGSDVLTVTATSATATAAAGSEVKATKSVTVAEMGYTVSVTPIQTTLAQGAVQKFYARITSSSALTTAIDQTVTWRVVAPDGSTQPVSSSIDSKGILTVSNSERNTKLLVYATSTVYGEEGHAEVTVAQSEYVLTVTAANGAKSVKQGDELQLTASVTKDGEVFDGLKIDWTCSAPSTIDANGKLTVDINHDIGANALGVTATATTPDGRTISGNVLLEVLDSDFTVSIYPVNGVNITGKQGETTVLEARVFKDGNAVPDADQEVRWLLEGNTSEKTTLDQNGNLVIDRDEKARELTVTAQSVKFSTEEIPVEAQVAVPVSRIAYTVEVEPASSSVTSNGSIEFTAKVYADGVEYAVDPNSISWIAIPTVCAQLSTDPPLGQSMTFTFVDCPVGDTFRAKASVAINGDVYQGIGAVQVVSDYAVSITDGSDPVAANVEIAQSGSGTYTASLTSNLAGGGSATPTWAWTTTGNTGVTLTNETTATVTVNVAADAATTDPATVTATATVDGQTYSASFTVTPTTTAAP